MTPKSWSWLALPCAFALSASASASIVLDFEHIADYYPTPGTADVNGYYNGGQASNGRTGPNYGVEFIGGSVFCMNTPGYEDCNASWGTASPSQWFGFYWLKNHQPIMNVAAGFSVLEFLFSNALNATITMRIYDGLNGTGQLLTSLTLPATPQGEDCDPDFAHGAIYCPLDSATMYVPGIGRSVVFGGDPENRVIFDNITIPEPAAWTLLAAGAGLAGALRRRRQS